MRFSNGDLRFPQNLLHEVFFLEKLFHSLFYQLISDWLDLGNPPADLVLSYPVPANKPGHVGKAAATHPTAGGIHQTGPDFAEDPAAAEGKELFFFD